MAGLLACARARPVFPLQSVLVNELLESSRRGWKTSQRETQQREAEETRPVVDAVDGGYPSPPSPTAVKLAWRPMFDTCRVWLARARKMRDPLQVS